MSQLEKRLQVTQTGKKVYLGYPAISWNEYLVTDTKTRMRYTGFNGFRAEGLARCLEEFYMRREVTKLH